MKDWIRKLSQKNRRGRNKKKYIANGLGKASSHDVLYPRSAPYRRELSLQMLNSSQKNGAFHLYSPDPILTSSPNRSPSANETEGYYNHDYNQNTDSETTLDESGISSKGSSMLDDTPVGASTSAPSTPCMSIRRKAPPKPPRVRSIFEPLGPDSQSALPYHSCGTALPNVTAASQRVDSLKSSLAYVTHTLDRSVAKSDPSGCLVMKHNPMAMKNKVFYVLMQLKDFLVQEINPSLIVDFLHQHGVINSWTEQELRRCKTADAMCEMLLDVVSTKGKEEFGVLCKSLRIVERHDYLADLLYVVDRLVDIGTPCTSTLKYSSLSRANSRISSGYESNYGVPNSESHCNGVLRQCEKCPECATNNNGGEVLNECSTFDIEVSYLDIQTGEIVPNEIIKQLKRRSTRALPNQRRKRMSSVDSYLLKTDKENADRYVPVLSVSLYNQCLYGKGIENLTQILERYCSIRELSLAKNHLDLNGMDRMGRALYRNRGLLKLDMRLNTISDEAASCICQGLRWNTSLRVLNISSTGLTGRGCTNLIEGLVKNLTLVELDVGFNDLQDEGCVSVSKLLATNCNLRKLRMRNNSITDKGLTVLFRALKKNARLSVLDIGSNKCGTESMMTMAEMLLCNRTLRELTLEKCNISIAGCVSLARAMKTNTTLKFLDLSMNKIGDLGANSLSDGLKYNQVLDTLCLNMCRISNLGFMKLLISLRYNTAMCTLKLCYNDIGHATPAAESHTINRSLDTSFFSSSQCSPNSSQDTISFYNQMEPTAIEDIPNVDEVYEKLAQILQYNKNLKVLLWGNKLQEFNTQ